MEGRSIPLHKPNGEFNGSVSLGGKKAPTASSTPKTTKPRHSNDPAKANYKPRLDLKEIQGDEPDIMKLPTYKRFQLASYEPSRLGEALVTLSEAQIGDLYRAQYVGEGSKIATKLITFDDGTWFNLKNSKFTEEGTLTEESLKHLRAGAFDDDGIHFVLTSVAIFSSGGGEKTWEGNPNPGRDPGILDRAIDSARAEIDTLYNEIVSSPLFLSILVNLEQTIRSYGDTSQIIFFEEAVINSKHSPASPTGSSDIGQLPLFLAGYNAKIFKGHLDPKEYEVLTRFNGFLLALSSISYLSSTTDSVDEIKFDKFVGKHRFFLQSPDLLDMYGGQEEKGLGNSSVT